MSYCTLSVTSNMLSWTKASASQTVQTMVPDTYCFAYFMCSYLCQMSRLVCCVIARVPVSSPFNLFSHGGSHIIHVYTRKTLKTVSFHTGSRGVLFDGIRFQQTRNTILCLQFDHTQLFQSTTDCFTLQLCSEFNWKYGQIGPLCSLWFPNFIQ